MINQKPSCNLQSICKKEIAQQKMVFAGHVLRDCGTYALVILERTRSPAIAEGPRDAGVPVEIW